MAAAEATPIVSASMTSAADLAVTDLYETHYCSLVRLAALLTGDAGIAQDIVQDSFVAMHRAWNLLRDRDKALSHLRQSVVRRSRSAPRPPAADRAAAGAACGAPGRAGPGRSPVTSAIRALPCRQREALVLRFYLDLPDEQVASAMGVSPAAGRDYAASAKANLSRMT